MMLDQEESRGAVPADSSWRALLASYGMCSVLMKAGRRAEGLN
jgi:hypothetical protein